MITRLPFPQIRGTAVPNPSTFPGPTVLIYTTADGTRLAARPSGTEPKIKFYISVSGRIDTADAYPRVTEELDSKIDRILEELKLNG